MLQTDRPKTLTRRRRENARWRPVTPTSLVEGWGEHRIVREWAWMSGTEAPRLCKLLNMRLPLEVAVNVPLSCHINWNAPAGGPESWTWHVLPFECDKWANDFCDAHPAGATLDEVARVLGTTRERVRQIEEAALSNLRRELVARGFSEDDCLAWFAYLDDARGRRNMGALL